ncbi:MAG: hypothetical protein L6R35_000863 [Caloplaca aegaea]|nr:MAG: hypothetical protein L6R35_000863 [Caloplaca aegaea]
MFPFSRPNILPRYANIPYTPLTSPYTLPPTHHRLHQLLKPVSVLLLLAAAIITTTCLLHTPKLSPLSQPTLPIPVIPESFRVVGLVFYGRRDRVEVLDCYLKQNLLSNGGLLSEIIFLARTDDVDDLAYLDELVESTPGYTRRDVGGKATYGQAWEVVQRGVMYVKVDDDVVSEISYLCLARRMRVGASRREKTLTFKIWGGM